MKALVGAFNQEKALVGAFSVIVQPVVKPMDRFTALFKKQIEFWVDLYVEHTEPRIAAAGARIKIRELR